MTNSSVGFPQFYQIQQILDRFLAASARDFLSDALTSTGTMLAIIGASLFRIHWIDPVAALLLGCFIIWNGARFSAQAPKSYPMASVQSCAQTSSTKYSLSVV
ncbi:cation transporter [Lacticaseibacillus zeae]|uniref:cation transporter n=1 Tax=Lacticaseibacillus zeae TaxID=57037 RepID=UPI0027954AA4|nr:cation transporter [Lacticaseibacillus sp. NCIMB 15474]WLV85640.1 cation transporter [Lacticaseibacillus sp. NCIMB 15474]